MAKQESAIQKLTRIRANGERILERLKDELAQATSELTVLNEAMTILEPTGSVNVRKITLVPILEERKRSLEFRYSVAKEVFTAFEKYINRIICSDCNGLGQIRYIICEDESEYKDCSTCGGLGVER